MHFCFFLFSACFFPQTRCPWICVGIGDQKLFSNVTFLSKWVCIGFLEEEKKNNALCIKRCTCNWYKRSQVATLDVQCTTNHQVRFFQGSLIDISLPQGTPGTKNEFYPFSSASIKNRICIFWPVQNYRLWVFVAGQSWKTGMWKGSLALVLAQEISLVLQQLDIAQRVASVTEPLSIEAVFQSAGSLQRNVDKPDGTAVPEKQRLSTGTKKKKKAWLSLDCAPTGAGFEIQQICIVQAANRSFETLVLWMNAVNIDEWLGYTKRTAFIIQIYKDFTRMTNTGTITENKWKEI